MQKPTLDIPLMEAIVTLADELSYTNAAKILDMSQSGLSRRIQVAERRLNRRLFERDRATVLLTDAGRTCVEECRLAIEHEERAIRFTKAISQNIDCNLSVGRSQTALIPSPASSMATWKAALGISKPAANASASRS